MSKDGETVDTEFLRVLCGMRGLERAFVMFPDIVTAAFVRGRRPIGALPEKFSPATEPASQFAAEPEGGE